MPYAVGRVDEQTPRARRLEKPGALRVVDPDSLSGTVLADAVRDAQAWRPLSLPLDLEGRTNTAGFLQSLRPQRAEATS